MMAMEREHVFELGDIADEINTLIASQAVPLPNANHVIAIRNALPRLRDRLRAIFVAEIGENPWD